MVSGIQYARQLAQQLLAIEGVVFNPQKPFSWSSGWKSPIYCDNRLLLSYPAIRNSIRDQLSAIVQKPYKPDAIVGVATAGIPHASLVADVLDLPLAYVRSKPKEHGTENKVEGSLAKGQQVVIIEDLISTGGSSMAAIEAVQETGCTVQKLCAIFTYEFDHAAKLFQDKGIRVETLSNYPTLLEIALKEGYIPQDAMETLQQWRSDPANWGK